MPYFVIVLAEAFYIFVSVFGKGEGKKRGNGREEKEKRRREEEKKRRREKKEEEKKNLLFFKHLGSHFCFVF